MDRFRYGEEPSLCGVLEIHVHHARNIHNICIYDNQDVYAKFSLTYDPDFTLSTRVITAGGKNPDFHETLRMAVSHLDAVLKCEIWMLSRAPTLLEDQLLGFALVPLSQLAGKYSTKITKDHTLSSTDLFHSPAGTVKLTISLITSESPATSSSVSDEVVEEDCEVIELGRIEFPDIDIARQNQRMVREYFDLATPGPFLRLGAYETETETETEETMGPAESSSGTCDTPTSLRKGGGEAEKVEGESSKDGNADDGSEAMGKRSVFVGPVEMEAEQAAMQQQIVDMYMRSMQQFTESLAKMKLPMELDKAEPRQDRDSDSIQSLSVGNSNKLEIEKKDGSRVFYGSRAFF